MSTLFKTLSFNRLTEAQTWDVDNLGVRIFAFHENAVAIVRSLLETALLFTALHTKGGTPMVLGLVSDSSKWIEKDFHLECNAVCVEKLLQTGQKLRMSCMAYA